MKKILSIIFLTAFLIPAQSKDPDEILERLMSNFERIEDYKVDINIKLDVQHLKAPESKATLYFKKPDKIHIESDGFAMIPREGLGFAPLSFLKKDYTAIYEKDETLNGHKVSIVKIIPLGDKSDIILTTLWIDQSINAIRKSETTTKFGGNFSIKLDYDDKIKYPLPAKMEFMLNANQDMVAKDLHELDEKAKPERRRRNVLTSGTVYITYSNYEINKGIPDSIFEKKVK